MAERIEPYASREGDEFKRFLDEFDPQGFVAGGAVPDGHEGVYTPTTKELHEALVSTYDAALQTGVARREAVERLMERLRQQEERAR